MKKIFGLSLILLISILSLLQFSMTSCTKDHTITDTVTVIKKDTLVQVKTDTLKITDTTITTKILTANPWKLQEERGVIANMEIYYLLGGSSNLQNFDNDYFIFNADKTGTYTDHSGTQYILTWDFASPDNTKIVQIINNFPTSGTSTTVHWENVRYKDGSLKYDEYYFQNGNYEHCQAVRIPKGS